MTEGKKRTRGTKTKKSNATATVEKVVNVAEIINNASQKYAQEIQKKGLLWEGSFAEYLEIVKKNPAVTRNAFQRLYDMILSYGTEEYIEHKERIVKYNFFDDIFENGKDAVFGLDRPLMKFMNVLNSAAKGYGTQRRVWLLHGPVGSAKSTIVRLLKKGLEHYSKTPLGALYSFRWEKHVYYGMSKQQIEDAKRKYGVLFLSLRETDTHVACPHFEEPLKLIPLEAGDGSPLREKIIEQLISNKEDLALIENNAALLEGELCPLCRMLFQSQLRKYKGDFQKILENDIQVFRVILSEKDRIGIGTFQPKDEKNQDSTELTGDINYRRIADYGSDSDPRAFNFDGEFNVANRGLVEFIEVLKLEVAFLYDLLGASQEHEIKPRKFPLTDIDEVIIGHTNEPEYKKLQANEFMEALRDRTIKIDIPYITKLSDEMKIYERDGFIGIKDGKHIAPHTVEIASMWAVLTRLEEPKKAKLTLLQKLKLYNGKTLPGFTEDNIKELKAEAEREGMEGISPRYIQDKLSNALVGNEKPCLNPFMVLNELEEGLKHHSLIKNEEQRKKYRDLLAVVKEEYEDIVKSEVQRAIAADEEALKRLCGNYIDNVKAYTQKEKIKNRYTGKYEDPDERLMRSVEQKIDIPESRKDDFRREIMNYIGALALEGKKFDYRSNERLQKAFELKLFEDQKDSIKLTTLVSSVVDKETQKKIDVVKTRMIKYQGYCDICATDVLNFVSSIFARGDIKEKQKQES